MGFSNILRRFGVVAPLAVMAVIAVAVVATVPAVADPVAHSSASVLKTLKRAIGLSKKADKRSRRALKVARRALTQGGPQGQPGPQGPAGPAGLQGNPGMSASAAFSSTTDVDLVVPPIAEVASATITLPEAGRILAHASLQINANGGGDDSAFCYIESDGTDLGQRVTTAVPTTRGSLSLAGSIVKPSGAHTIKVQCGSDSGDSVTKDDVDLIVWAAKE